MDGRDGTITRRTVILGGVAAGLAATLPEAMSAQVAPEIRAEVNASRTGDPITPYMYGALEEHIGGLINYSLWAEVLDDRKFFYPVNNQPLGEPQTGRRSRGRKWRPISDSQVTMDRTNAYVGEQSPVVTLEGDKPRGFQQTALALARKAHVGRIVIACDPAARP